METKKVTEIKIRWGSKSCNHPDIEHETIHGQKTGNVVCTTCGRIIYS